jgi:predicted metalloprotease with PDZ domain
MKGDLLWVYEGLTQYLGQVLAARSGLFGESGFIDELAIEASSMSLQAGRSWRPLGDTATAASILYGSRPDGASWRRGVDFYYEGSLLWLEADVLIRQRSQGARSLDDFCKAFYGGVSGPPAVNPYQLDDVLAALNAVAPYDWRGFFAERVERVRAAAPLAGIEAGGWRLDYAAEPTSYDKGLSLAIGALDLSASIGLVLSKENEVLDVIPGGPADRAGVPSGAKLLGVNGRVLSKETHERLDGALASSAHGVPVELLLQDADIFLTAKLDYRGGPRYPALTRTPGKADLVGAISKPRVPPAAPAKAGTAAKP